MLLDLRLPGMDGWEVARRFRLAFGAEVPIVVASGRSDVTAADVAARIPTSAFLAKPFDLADLARALDRPRPGPR